MDVTVPFEQRAMLEEIRRFGENEIGPVADEFDRAEEYRQRSWTRPPKLGCSARASRSNTAGPATWTISMPNASTGTKITQLYEGTTEVQKNVIAREPLS
ncbi:acyl-CoA dehydrogenase [Natrialba aegyptia DSM 13077]|uniref:Acyl-CoA dehydrogenase n=1 Tax=Natrialba aegyptia DSM 13077 TaxID=1227491 RepID=M0AP56_9EURY|nr:acyl-CoA dehydrogenase [Natrialba aegyptia DSM 13077]